MATASRYSDRVKESVESLINCLICTDRFQEPKVLPCQHTFCLPCLEHFYRSYNDSRIISVSNFPCPQCRKSVYMPQGGLAALPTDFKVGQIREVFDRMNIAGTSRLYCDICRYEDKFEHVTSFCVHCSKYLCDKCRDQHASSTIFRGHTAVPLSASQSSELLCALHKEVVKYFCRECKSIICTVCALSRHSKHETLDLPNAIEHNRLSLQGKVEVLKSNLTLHENKAERYAAISRVRQTQADKLKEAVKRHSRHVINRIREEEIRMSKEIDSVTQRLAGEVDGEIEGLHETARQMRALCDATDSFLQQALSLELIKRYDSFADQLDPFLQPPALDIDEQFHKELTFEAQSKQKLGRLVISTNMALVTPSEPPEQVAKETSLDYTPPSSDKTKAASDTEASGASPKKAASDKASDGGAVSKTKKESEDASASKKKAGDSIKGKLRKFEKLANGAGPCYSLTPGDKTEQGDKAAGDAGKSDSDSGSSCSDTSSLASSSSTTPRTMDTLVQTRSQSNIYKGGQTASGGNSGASEGMRTGGKRDGSPDDTCGAVSPRSGSGGAEAAPKKPKDKLRLQWKTVDNAMSRSTGFFADGTSVVTEYKEGSDKLQLFDADGNLTKCVACSGQNIVRPWGCAVNHQLEHIVITDHGDRSVKVLDKQLTLKQTWRSLFERPSGVAVMRNGDYVITDTGKSAMMVSIHTAMGIRKREFGTKGNDLEELLDPQYVCVDSSDRIIVSDAALNCVKIYDPRGTMLLKFQAAKEPPLQPHGVCTDAHNNILVADHAHNTISLFSSDGLFMRHIAQLNEHPYGIAVHDNGSMAVATDSSLHMLYVPCVRTL